jgi:hypothetical protein
MVNVTDGADVAVRLVTLEFFLGHGPVPNVQCEEIGSASGFDERSIEPFGRFFKGGWAGIVAQPGAFSCRFSFGGQKAPT